MSNTNGLSTDGRISFARIEPVQDYPDFLGVQVDSFEDFVQDKVVPEERQLKGLQNTFTEHFPIQDSRERYMLEFVHYSIEAPKHSVAECIAQGLSFSVPLKARLRLSSRDDEDEDEPEEAIEQDVYLGNLPFMTERGSFVINGAERVVVSQLHRSPGVFFGQSVHPNGTALYSARVIPLRGSWIEFSTDVGNVMWAYIDRKKKLPVTTLLRALGYSSDEDILKLFQLSETVELKPRTKIKSYFGRRLASNLSVVRTHEVVDEDTGELLHEIKEHEIILPAEHVLTEASFEKLKDNEITKIFLLKEDAADDFDRSTLVNTLKKDPAHSQDEALSYLYTQLRGAEPPDVETARGMLERLFFSEKRYDLGEVGRYRLNKRLSIQGDPTRLTLDREDILSIILELVNLQNGKSSVDDIDHLGNRRVRSVGEQLSAQFSLGLARMARTIKERMNLRDAEKLTPQDLVNARTISSVINTFFGTNQLSQFMDQTNPLAELTHKRRMSALGPGGLTRERAGFEVRDGHYTHYGRLCPIETPEGPNIGLISSLCVHGRVNEFGFIETPYRQVQKGKVTTEIQYLSAEEEDNAIVAQANAPIDKRGRFVNEYVKCRHHGDFVLEPPEVIQFMDISPNQIVSPAASLIPFLEHDDANRALMGSNMQRQAVPLLRPEAPIVGTGLEGRAARDSRALVIAEGPGVVLSVDAKIIEVAYDRDAKSELVSFEDSVKRYDLIKFRRTNQDTCVNQKPVVKVGQRVEMGTLLADGCATENGEVALGKNLMVAFMPWRGYNFEDAIVISERVVTEDIYTSIHIEEFELQVRDTKRGEEELTREIPNVSEEATKDLDERGIIRIGAEVTAGDIIVGKITPKGETDPTPEEKLLRAIFGDKAGDVKDASLKAPPGMKGVVIETKLYSRRKSDPASRKKDQQLLKEIDDTFETRVAALNEQFLDRFFKIVVGKTSNGIQTKDGKTLVVKGAKITKPALEGFSPGDLNITVAATSSKSTNELVSRLMLNYNAGYRTFEAEQKRDKHLIQMGDELPPGILQLAKVYVARKRKLQVGDKMAGRHGNKGVVAKIVPVQDMPYLEDGTPVDIVLNPLGVPSRMNLGQIFETLLGWAGKALGVRFATPVFDGATEEDIRKALEDARLPIDGRVQLYDGMSGHRFDQLTTVGIMYMLKLSHLVEDKIHARSIGPYSLITQQPLGGKAQFGGQRFGEMEVWALEAYGAAHTLQEMLTVKSDDVQGRSKVYEAIVKGENLPEPNVPESFNVLVRELQGLGLEVKIE